MKSRQYSKFDQVILVVDSILGNLFKLEPVRGKRPYPAKYCTQPDINENQKRHVAGLMRVNHAGEVAAQALYKAQALTAREEQLKVTMQQSADEETDHLDWCESRLKELHSHPSYLQPVWYFGSFGIGFLAGCFGDKWNLGFLTETEYQVVKHLDSHLKQLPEDDQRSRAILVQMREDELRHATTAEAAGAETLPKEVKNLMNLVSKFMTKIAYKI